MIDRVISFFLRTPVVTVALMGVLVVWGLVAVNEVPVDAIPDIGENQTLVFTQWPGRSPRDVYDQITFPLSVELEGIPGVKTIRGTSGFGFSTIYVIFKDGVDFYWARTRVMEKLNTAARNLPEGVTPMLGPDATAMGQVFWYTVENGWWCPSHAGRWETREDHDAAHPDCTSAPEESRLDLQELRSVQDWQVRLALNAVEGVSEVASVGGTVKQYQIDVDPDRLRAHGVAVQDVVQAVRRSNLDVGAKTVQEGGVEFLLRGVGFIKNVSDVEDIVVRAAGGVPVTVKDVGAVHLGPDFRRGALDKEGAEAVGGVVVMRTGENPLKVIERVKEKIRSVEPGLPQGVRVVAFYDRTGLVQETLGTLRTALSEELIVTVVVILLFLLHLRSSLVVSLTLPVAVLMAFVAMRTFRVDSNIMSLSGIAIAIGTMVDMGIIMTENVYSRLSEQKPGENRTDLIFSASSEVGSAILTAIATTIVSFLPVFLLTDQEGKLFGPLAYTKTFALFSSVLVALIFVPLLCRFLLFTAAWSRRRAAAFAGGVALAALVLFAAVLPALGVVLSSPLTTGLVAAVVAGGIAYRVVRETLKPLDQNPVSRVIHRVYERMLRLLLRKRAVFFTLSVGITAAGFSVWLGGAAVFPWVWALAASAGGFALGGLVFDRLHGPAGGVRAFRIRFGVSIASAVVVAFFAGVLNPDALSGRLPAYASLRDDVFPGIGREFMPPLDEGSFLYMPSLLPSASFKEVQEVLRRQDVLMKQVPEVDVVVGKLGRVDSALDPAPVGMIETVVMLKPESSWRRVAVPRWFSGWPDWLKAPLALAWPETRAVTKDEILQDLRMRTDMAGVAPSWLQPIETRVVMLQSGFKGQMGVKIFGEDLAEIERIGVALEGLIKGVPGAADVVADRIVGKPYVEFRVDRLAAARYGLKVGAVQDVLETALGGKNLVLTVEGEERYPVRVRYVRDSRTDLASLDRILVPAPSGAQVPVGLLADVRFTVGPAMIRSEHSRKVGYVTFNARGRDEISVAEDVHKAIEANWGRIATTPGYWTDIGGRFENQIRATRRLMILVPLSLLVNFFILFLHFRKLPLTFVVFLRIPQTLAGGFILIGLAPLLQPVLGLETVNLSVAVWVGFIALFGIAVDDGVVIATYMGQHFKANPVRRFEDIRERIVAAGLRRIRPSLMTSITTILALMPVLLSTGRGSDVMKPMALPTVGGMTVELLSLFAVPLSYAGLLELRWRLGFGHEFFAVHPAEAMAEQAQGGTPEPGNGEPDAGRLPS